MSQLSIAVGLQRQLLRASWSHSILVLSLSLLYVVSVSTDATEYSQIHQKDVSGDYYIMHDQSNYESQSDFSSSYTRIGHKLLPLAV